MRLSVFALLNRRAIPKAKVPFSIWPAPKAISPWTPPLPQPITIPKVMALKSLADVRKLLGHIPNEAMAGINVATRPNKLRCDQGTRQLRSFANVSSVSSIDRAIADEERMAKRDAVGTRRVGFTGFKDNQRPMLPPPTSRRPDERKSPSRQLGLSWRELKGARAASAVTAQR